MPGTYGKFLKFLDEGCDEELQFASYIGHYFVVARKQQETHLSGRNLRDDQIINVALDENENAIVMICIPLDTYDTGHQKYVDDCLRVEELQLILSDGFEQYQDCSLMVSQFNEEDDKWADVPLDSVEIDDDAHVLRLFF